MSGTVGALEVFRAGLDDATRAMIDRLRAIVTAAHPALVEGFKWNAPSFATDGGDRITLGVERKGGVRLVLHRGAKARDVDGFSFDDVDRLATWPAPDRGVVVWQDLAAIDRAAASVERLCRRWIERVDGVR